jgi:hypothetical protein
VHSSDSCRVDLSTGSAVTEYGVFPEDVDLDAPESHVVPPPAPALPPPPVVPLSTALPPNYKGTLTKNGKKRGRPFKNPTAAAAAAAKAVKRSDSAEPAGGAQLVGVRVNWHRRLCVGR